MKIIFKWSFVHVILGSEVSDYKNGGKKRKIIHNGTSEGQSQGYQRVNITKVLSIKRKATLNA